MNSTLLTGLFADFAASSWRAAWLIVVLASLRVVVRGRIPAGVWFVAWIIVAVRLLVPFSVPASWSPYNLTAVRAPAALAPAALELPLTPPSSIEPAFVVAPPLESPPPLRRENPAPDWTARVALVWLGGALVVLGARAIALWRLRRELRYATEADPRIAAIAQREAACWGIRRSVACRETTAVDAPALFGLWRPQLLFPPGFAAHLTDDELRLVVRHELAHWRRRDLLAQCLLQAAVALHWFNPLAWLAARLARTDCELACDEFVLRREAADGGFAYGHALLKVLSVVRVQRRPTSVVAILEGKQQLAHRVRMIAGYRASTAGRLLGGALLLAVLAAASVTRESHAQEAPAATPTVPASTSPTSLPAPPPTAEDPDAERKARIQRQTRAVEQLQTTVEEQRQKVDALAHQLQAFKDKHRLGSLDQRTDLVNASLKSASLEAQRASVVADTARMRVAQIQDFRARGADLTTLSFVASQPAVAELMQQISKQRITVATLNERYRDAHPQMISATNALALTQRELDRTVKAACDQVESDLQAAAIAYQERHSDLERQRTEALELDRQTVQYRQLEREFLSQNQVLQNIVARAREETAAAAARAESDEFNVSVLGAVNAQGVVALRRADQPIALDAIARAGGFAAHADRTAVRLLRADAQGTRTTTVLAEEALMNGQGFLQPRDVLVVPERTPPAPRTVTITGAVNSPGLVAFPSERNLTIVDALALAGGHSRLADIRQVRLTRTDPKTQATTATTINVDALLRRRDDSTPNVTLEPGDLVFVPERVL